MGDPSLPASPFPLFLFPSKCQVFSADAGLLASQDVVELKAAQSCIFFIYIYNQANDYAFSESCHVIIRLCTYPQLYGVVYHLRLIVLVIPPMT